MEHQFTYDTDNVVRMAGLCEALGATPEGAMQAAFENFCAETLIGSENGDFIIESVRDELKDRGYTVTIPA